MAGAFGRFGSWAGSSGITALVGTVGETLLVGRRDEENVAGFDERGMHFVEGVAGTLGDAVGQSTRVEPILQLPLTIVVLAFIRAQYYCGRSKITDNISRS